MIFSGSCGKRKNRKSLKISKSRLLLLTFKKKKDILKSPSSWGVSGALYQQSATVGVISGPGFLIAELPFISGVDVWVLRNRTL